ncbi:MAG: transketolase [Alphaproteobacteria bacterium]
MTAADRASPAELANALRALAMDAVQAAKSGHPGMPMGMADVATVLFTKFLKFDAQHPDWPDRDRFVLSAGHGSMLLYGLLHLTGYADFPMDELRNFRQFGAKTAGHPEYGHGAGIETTTGPLGQGIANAVGMALAERLMNHRFGDSLVDHRTYVIAGDGCLMEGISHEAASFAGHLKLNKLIVLFDDNGITIDGGTELSCSDDARMRFESYGWATDAVDGHDQDAVAAAIRRAHGSDRPTLIACKTHIGFGAPTKQDKASAHGAPLGDEEIEGTRAALGWSAGPFEIPEPIAATWRAFGARGEADRQAWQDRLDADDQRQAFQDAIAGDVAAALQAPMQAFKEAQLSVDKAVATRQSSGNLLSEIAPALPTLLGGSADLTGSNLTRAENVAPVAADNYGGRYVFYGVREHAMAAAMNGMALHKGVIPFGGTFLVFTDYCRPAIRLSALMGIRVVYVMTHDSIGLGEDGPTHQPVEHLAALRAVPNLRVFRPADAIEVAECWELALNNHDGPAVLALTRQGVPRLRNAPFAENRSARGAYEIIAADGEPAVTLFATGSEVGTAAAARDLLQADGHPTRVISVPSWELFAQQPADYRDAILRPTTVRVAVEAGMRMGWERFVGTDGGFVGMDGFGASAPAGQLYEHFGITAASVASEARRLLAARAQ